MCGLSPQNCPKYFTVCHLIVPQSQWEAVKFYRRVHVVHDYADTASAKSLTMRTSKFHKYLGQNKKRSLNCFCLFKRGPGKVFDKTGSKISGHCPFYAFIQHQLVGLIIPRYTVSWSLYCTATVAWTAYAHNMTLSERIIENVLTFSASWLRKTFTTPWSHLKIWLNFSF